MDTIIHAGVIAIQNGLHRHPTMATYVNLAKKLAPELPELHGGKPNKSPPPARFVYDENAIRTATELTLGRPKVYRQVMAQSRAPYPCFWIEWEDIGRVKLREKFKQPEALQELRPFPQRFGFFIETGPNYDTRNPSYRRGKITWAWTQKTHKLNLPPEMAFLSDMPNISGITSHFDLDADFQIELIEKYPLQLAQIWADNPIQHEAFTSIWRTVRQEADEAAIAGIIGQQRPGEDKLADFARAMLYADVVGEYIMTWACMMVMSAARNRNSTGGGVELRSVDMSKLNKGRLRNGKVPLLNHRTVHIVSGSRAVQMRGPLDYSRKSPHIHLVGSYLGWHGKIVFPYTRGSRPAP